MLPDGEIAGVTAYNCGLWDGDTAFQVGDTVAVQTGVDGNNQPIYSYYQCVTAHTSGTTFNATEQQDWRLLTSVPCGIYYQNFIDSYSLDKVPLLPGRPPAS